MTKQSEPRPSELQPLLQLFEQNRLEAASEQSSRLLRRYPGSARLHNFHGIVSAGLQRPQEAVASYRRAVTLAPDFADAHANLAATLCQLGDYRSALASLTRLHELGPDSADLHFNLGIAHQASGNLQEALASYRRCLELNPDIAEAHNNLGLLQAQAGEPQAALESYLRAIAIQPTYAEAHNNIGAVLHETGVLGGALESLQKALELKPGLIDAHNHSGNVYTDLGDLPAARACFQRALNLDADYAEACWNMAGTAADPLQALHWLERCLRIDPEHLNASLLRAALLAAQGQPEVLRELQAQYSEHPYVRSFNWVFDLPQLPELYCNRWAFFDGVAKLCDSSRVFYEFGVWRGQSFRYLLRYFERGIGFDTFSGLPDDWHEKKRGSYSSGGQIPDISGGEFIEGAFERSLPAFFAEPRPLAALINFDADLYSSTLCALENARAVIDESTVLVFDEFIMNEHWELDEYRALEEFCDKQGCDYEVLAVCFFSKQVAVRLSFS